MQTPKQGALQFTLLDFWFCFGPLEGIILPNGSILRQLVRLLHYLTMITPEGMHVIRVP